MPNEVKTCDLVEEEHHFTNADRIRAMRDEELCQLLMDAPAVPCNEKISFMMKKNNCDDCQSCIMEWLQQPAEEATP